MGLGRRLLLAHCIVHALSIGADLLVVVLMATALPSKDDVLSFQVGSGRGIISESMLFSSLLTMLLSVCVLFLAGGASVILSLGLVTWCDTVTDHNKHPFSCAQAESVLLFLDVNTSSFYTELSLAEISLWAITALWLTQSILAFLRLYLSHSQNMSGPCLPREK